MELVIDRRGHTRGELFTQRRRYPRIEVAADIFYESDSRALFSERAEVSLRGLFVPCRVHDGIGTRGVVRVDAGTGALVKCEVEVIRASDPTRVGMALRWVNPQIEGLDRIGKMLVRVAGIPALPQLQRRFELITQMPRQFARLAA